MDGQDNQPLANGADTAPAVGLISQYVKDLSFENPNAPAIYQNETPPEINVQVDIGAGQVGEEVHGVVVKIEVEAASDQLVDPLVSINCLINPGAVIIGGRLPAGWIDDLSHALNAKLAAHRHHVPVLAPVLKARLATEAPAVGAAILPFSHFLLPKSTALWPHSTAPIIVQQLRVVTPHGCGAHPARRGPVRSGRAAPPDRQGPVER